MFSSPAHPASAGLVERQNRTVIALYRKYLETSNEWVSLLPKFQFALNSSVQASIGQTPFFLLYGCRPQITSHATFHNAFAIHGREKYNESEMAQKLRQMGRANEIVFQAHTEAFEKQKEQFDKRAKSKSFRVGDLVFCTRPHSGKQFQKFQPRYHGPFTVVEVRSNDNYVIQLKEHSRLLTVHANRLKLAPVHLQLYDLIPPTSEIKQPLPGQDKPEAIDRNLGAIPDDVIDDVDPSPGNSDKNSYAENVPDASFDSDNMATASEGELSEEDQTPAPPPSPDASRGRPSGKKQAPAPPPSPAAGRRTRSSGPVASSAWIPKKPLEWRRRKERDKSPA